MYMALNQHAKRAPDLNLRESFQYPIVSRLISPLQAPSTVSPSVLQASSPRDGIAPLPPRRIASPELLPVVTTEDQQLQRVQSALAESQKSLQSAEAALERSRLDILRARHSALHDETTGLPNRKLFDDRLTQAISVAARHQWTLAVLFVDLDKFKTINDSYGHATGDKVLIEVANRLAQRTRDEDTVCRYGGDEFLFLLMNPRTHADIQRIAEVMIESISQPIISGTHTLCVGASIGIAVYPDDSTAGTQLIRNADVAMYRAKARQQGVAFYQDF